MTTARISSAIAAVFVLSGCGGSSNSNQPAGRQELTGPLVLDPGVMCVGPACRGVPMETVRLAPPAPPVIPTGPLPPISIPPLSLPVPTVAGGGDSMLRAAFDSHSLRMGSPAGSTDAVTAPPPPPGCTNWTVQMQVLVISTDGKEADLPAIQQALGYHTIPYTTWIATQKLGPGPTAPAAVLGRRWRCPEPDCASFGAPGAREPRVSDAALGAAVARVCGR